MGFELAPLPYGYDQLEPHISAETLKFHHDKHHRKYVETLNELIEGTDFEGTPLVEIIGATHDDDERPLFNNAAQSWNHEFFWHCMTPGGGGRLGSADLENRIKETFGSLSQFKDAFVETATGQFGSGWAWLVAESNGTLAVTKTPNAENPLIHDQTPLLTCDVWEHAYYLDYQNRRGAFVQTFLDELVNWDFVARNYDDVRHCAAVDR